MIGGRVTGSKMHRILRCPASAALPQVDDLEPRPAAQRGTAIHRFYEDVSNGRTLGLTTEAARSIALERAQRDPRVTGEVLAYLEILDVEAAPTHLAAEVAIAYDWHARTSRELGRGLSREAAYAAVDYEREIPLTIDVLGVAGSNDGAPADWIFVADYKTGHADVPPPEINGQLVVGAVAAIALWPAAEAELQIVRPTEDGDPIFQRARITAMELDSAADRIEEAMERVEDARDVVASGGTPNVSTGGHCRYCPAFRACPAQTSLVRAALSGPPVRSGGMLAPGALEPSRLADTWRALRQARVALGALEGEVLMLASRDPIDLGDGLWLGPVETARERIADADAVHAILDARYGRAAADAAMTRRTSKTAIRASVAKYKRADAKLSTRVGDGELDRVLDAIRSVGASGVTRSIRVQVAPRDRLVAPVALASAPEEIDDSDEFG